MANRYILPPALGAIAGTEAETRLWGIPLYVEHQTLLFEYNYFPSSPSSYSTVTDLAKFLGLSMSQPRATAM